jgi:hypothetical protein
VRTRISSRCDRPRSPRLTSNHGAGGAT